MSRRHAIDIAIDARVRKDTTSLLVAGPLPEGVKSLLRIVADGECRDAETEQAYRHHSPDAIRAASAAFLAAVLFGGKPDPYRVLGLSPGAAAEDVRENKRLLLKWLHPDRNPSPEAKAYLGRVLQAAEAIEDGRAGGSAGGVKPPPIVFPARKKPSRRPRQSRARATALSIAEAAMRAVKIALIAAAAVIAILVAWRYLMQEPIGVSVERYAKVAMGMIAWR